MSDYYELPQSEAIQNVARAIHALGVGNAATDMGAMEHHASVMKDAINLHGAEIAEGLSEVANALLAIADAISELKTTA